MKEIITVAGATAPEELGYCQCHEHIALRKGKAFDINPALCIDDMGKSLEELKRYKAMGGNSIIEAQPCGCGRMAEELVSLSEKSGIQIIASTGFHKLSFYPDSHWIHTIPAGEFESILLEELTKGMFTDADHSLPSRQCKARAGIIKTAYDTEELTPRYKKLFKAAAGASLKTDRVIMVHIEQNTNPLPLQEYLTGLGVRPQDLIFCHMDRACPDLSVHRSILGNGSYLEFDTIGRFKYHSDEHEIQIFKKLIEDGYEKQLLYSLDTTRARLKAYDPSAVGLDYILTVFNHSLEAAGISRNTVRLFATENPVRALTQ